MGEGAHERVNTGRMYEGIGVHEGKRRKSKVGKSETIIIRGGINANTE